MKSDVIKVSNKGAGLDAALRQTELVCSFKGLGKRNHCTCVFSPKR